MNNLGDIIKYHRKKAALSQKSLAEVAGVGKTVVFDIEKGKETVQFNSIKKILKALNISLEFTSPLMDKYNSQNEKS